MNLETITNILVDNAERFRQREPDMSMFPEEEIPRIYAAAAEGTLRKRNFESTGQYLFLGKQWKMLLELGVSFFHSHDAAEQKAGVSFLSILASHDQLPKDVAVELADYILLKHDSGPLTTHWAAKVLHAGSATEKAWQIAYGFLKRGDFQSGTDFLVVSGKKLASEEAARFAGIALERGRYEDAFKFYESQSLPMPKDRAVLIAESDIGKRDSFWLFDRVVEYMDKTKTPFAADDFRKFGNLFFNNGHHWKALRAYERTGDLMPQEEYSRLGELILASSKEVESSRTNYSYDTVWQSVSLAFDYLSKSNPEQAKQRIAQYADDLLEQPDFAKAGSNVQQFGLIYGKLETPMPVPKALKAARISEARKRYPEAAKFYAAAGMKDTARRMGNFALSSDDRWQREYGSQDAFRAAGDAEGIAISRFLERNLSR